MSQSLQANVRQIRQNNRSRKPSAPLNSQRNQRNAQEDQCANAASLKRTDDPHQTTEWLTRTLNIIQEVQKIATVHSPCELPQEKKMHEIVSVGRRSPHTKCS